MALPLLHEPGLDADACYAAIRSRDPRFDGRFVTAVRTTGIYCRPSCPALRPQRANTGFVRTAAAAQRAGYRACKRCRPDAAPGSSEWDLRADIAGRVVRLVEDGLVDRAGVEGLASRVGFSTRQLRRHLVAELGAGPLTLARAHRARTARLLLESTDLPIADVAFAAGFGSVRQCNDTIRAIYAVTPGDLRRVDAESGLTASVSSGPYATLDLRLAFRPTADVPGVFHFLGRHAVEGIESYDGHRYARSMRLPYGVGVLEYEPDPVADVVRARFHLTELRDLAAAISRSRRMLALDADPASVDAQLAEDPVLAQLVARFPGRLVPGTHDGAETAIRTVVGQQVSVVGARKMNARIVELAGDALPSPVGAVTSLFPTSQRLATCDPTTLPMPRARAATVVRTAQTFVDGLRLDPSVDRERAEEQFRAIPGIGPWTAQYLRMRAMADPDVLLDTDLIVRRAMDDLGLPTNPLEVAVRTRSWSPWKSTVTCLLWASALEPRALATSSTEDPGRFPDPDSTPDNEEIA